VSVKCSFFKVVYVECLIGKQKKPILFKVTVTVHPSYCRAGTAPCARPDWNGYLLTHCTPEGNRNNTGFKVLLSVYFQSHRAEPLTDSFGARALPLAFLSIMEMRLSGKRHLAHTGAFDCAASTYTSRQLEHSIQYSAPHSTAGPGYATTCKRAESEKYRRTPNS
jgi:hypothetical protein